MDRDAARRRGVAGIYSLVSAATLLWLAAAFWTAPVTAPLWAVGDGLWGLTSVVMLLASVLLMGSLVRNPALPPGGAPAAVPDEATGVFAITRHPMMWSVALWGASHKLIDPVAKNIVVACFMIVMALVGRLAGPKKDILQPGSWGSWESRTSYLPFAAVAAGRARLRNFGMYALAGGVVIWLAATWAHIPLWGMAAGVWRWLR